MNHLTDAGKPVTSRKTLLRSAILITHLAVVTFTSVEIVAATPTADLPAELDTLNNQFLRLQEERVTKPFETAYTKLLNDYGSGIDRALVVEKAEGNLDNFIALEEEKKLFAANQVVPGSDDEKLPAIVKNLRTVFRDAHARLEKQRNEILKGLITPLETRLKQMEKDFIRGDRVMDAKTVRGYREALAELSQKDQPTIISSQAPSTSSTPRSSEGPKPFPSALNPAAAVTLKDGFSNTLGMKFVPVKGTHVLFCIHETRYKDYVIYAADVGGVDGAWKNQANYGQVPSERPDDYPVIKVNWHDANAFCEWLSKKENKAYRLPTDEEWSYAVGIGHKERRGKNITPAMLDKKEDTEFPWGGYPPRSKDHVGNYSDESLHAKNPQRGDYIKDFDDGYPTSAPVMNFKPNKLGLFDLGGNVWEWCQDWFDETQNSKVIRGASWHNPDRGTLLSSARGQTSPEDRKQFWGGIGFRVVLDVSDSAH